MLEKFKKNQEDLMIIRPCVNIYEQNNNIILAVEMPNVDKQTLDVNLDNNQLIIRAIKKKDEISKEYHSIHQERSRVGYERRFEINTEIDRDKIEAEYKNGILTVTLAKAEAEQPKKITIKS